MGLTQEQIEELLLGTLKRFPVKSTPQAETFTRRYKITQQEGPLRFVDVPLRCVSSGCASPTYMKVQGTPYCMMHSLRLLNQMLVAKGVLA